MKHFLQKEIEVILEKEFSFIADCCVRDYDVFKSFWEAPVGSILIAKHRVVNIIDGKPLTILSRMYFYMPFKKFVFKNFMYYLQKVFSYQQLQLP